MPDGLAMWLRSPGFSQALGPALCAQYAQRAKTPLHIQNVTRGMLWVTSPTTATNAAVTSTVTGFAPLATPVTGTITLSGRPLLIYVAATTQGGGGGAAVVLSATLRGSEVTGYANGIPGAYNVAAGPVGVSGVWIVPNPTPGDAEVELVADAFVADGIVYMDGTDNLVSLLAVEL